MYSRSVRTGFRELHIMVCQPTLTLIQTEAMKGSRIELWFTPSSDRKRLETELIHIISPPWNRK